VIIPAYNEEKRIEKTILSIASYLSQRGDYLKFGNDYEIIIIDDRSQDETQEIVEQLAKENKKIKIILNEKRYGKGYSVKKGMLLAEGGYLLFSDADLSTPIEELDKLLFWLEKGYDGAIGSRSLKDSQIIVHQPFYREIMGKIFNKFVKFICLPDFIDTQCGFKLFKKEVAKKIFALSKINRFAFDVEILYLAKKNNYKIKEVPIRWINSPASRVHPVFDSFKMLVDLVRIRFLHKDDANRPADSAGGYKQIKSDADG